MKNKVEYLIIYNSLHVFTPDIITYNKKVTTHKPKQHKKTPSKMDSWLTDVSSINKKNK